MLSGNTSGDFQDLWPVHRVNADVRRLFGNGNTPDTRSCANVQHARRRGRLRYAKMPAKRSRGCKAQRKQGLDEAGEEFGTIFLGVDLRRGPARPNYFTQLEPTRYYLIANVAEKYPIICWLRGHEKSGAFRGEGEAVAGAPKQIQADQDVQNRINAA